MHTSTHLDIEQLVKNQGFATAHEFAKIRLTAWLKRRVADSFFHSQQTQFQRLLDALQPEIKQPFNDFPEKRLQDYTHEQRQKVEEVLTALGYGNFDEFVLQEIDLYLQEHLRECQYLLRYYRAKYQVETYEDFANKFHDYAFDIIEKEDDGREWEDAQDSVSFYEETLSELRHAGQ